jgi:hypothetical protein
MRSSTTRCDVSVVNGGVNRDRGSRTSILVDLLIQNGLQLLVAHVGLVEDDVVVGGARSALESSVGTEVEVVLVGVGLARS